MLEADADQRLPTVAEVDEVLENQEWLRNNGGQGLALLVVSTLLFLGAQGTASDFPWTFIGLLLVVLVLHELGHLAAMRLFGFRDLRMFFIPFFGAAAAGRKPDATGAQRAIVALAGPLSGIVLAFAWMIAARMELLEVGEIGVQFLSLMLVLNYFNLLPIVPFDGGRFVNIVLFSRWPAAERVFRLCAGAALIYVATQMTSWILGIIGGFVVLGAGVQGRYAAIAVRLRELVPAPRPTAVIDTPAEVRSAALVELAPILGTRGPTEPRARRYANVLTHVWQRAIDAPPGPAATAALLAVYLLFAGIGVYLYTLMPA